MTSLLLIVLILVECAFLFRGQRELYAYNSRLLGEKTALILVAPGTVLHEGSHWLACILLWVPVTKVELFKPRRLDDGAMVFGEVGYLEPIGRRHKFFALPLIAVAPLIFVPLMLLGITAILLGSEALSNPLTAIGNSSWWEVLLWAYISLSAAQGAFPSTGDVIPRLGGAVVAGFFILIVACWPAILAPISLVLLLPALLAAGFLLGHNLMLRWRGPQSAE